MPQLRITSINIDGGTQPRVSLNESVVAEYAEAIRAGISLPPVDVYRDGSTYWLADGFHRFHAHRHADQGMIDCTVHVGTCRDAVLFSVGANANHGLRRSNEDKRRAVETLLQDDEWVQWSDREIAKACGVSAPFVAAIRSPDVAKRQQGNREASAARKVESDSSRPSPAGVIGLHPPAAAVESDSTAPTPSAADAAQDANPVPAPTHGGEAGEHYGLDEVLADLQTENRRLVEEIKAAEAIDQVAETLKWRRCWENAQLEQSQAMNRASESIEREKRTMNQLRRCGKAVGEEDPRKIPGRVEAAVKAAKEAGAWTA